MTVLIILSAFGIIASVVAIMYGSANNNSKKDWATGLGTIFLFILSYLLSGLLLMNAPFDVHSKKTNVKTEIRAEMLNDVEISRDTVYIFTRK